jgi:hypothetical protein
MSETDFLTVNEDQLTMVKLDLLNKINEFNHLREKLNENYLKTEEKINKQFELLLFSLQTRQSKLLDDLKQKYQEKKLFLENYIDEYQKNIYELNQDADKNLVYSAIDQLDFYADFQNLNAMITGKTNHLDLNALINNYGTITSSDHSNLNSNSSNSESSSLNESFRALSPSPLTDCQISGKGLVECLVNQEASFIISFKNRYLKFF